MWLYENCRYFGYDVGHYLFGKSAYILFLVMFIVAREGYSSNPYNGIYWFGIRFFCKRNYPYSPLLVIQAEKMTDNPERNPQSCSFGDFSMMNILFLIPFIMLYSDIQVNFTYKPFEKFGDRGWWDIITRSKPKFSGQVYKKQNKHP